MTCRCSTGSSTTPTPRRSFQVDPVPRDPETLGLPAGVRRAAHGGRPADLDGAAGEVSAGLGRIRTIYDEAPLAAYERAVRAGINYVIVGPPERDGT